MRSATLRRVTSLVTSLFTALAVLISAFSFMYALRAHAQYTIPQALPLELTVTPTYPRPHSSVNVSINAYAMDSAGARVSWYRNGVELVSERNALEIVTETGAIGKAVNISATVVPNGGTPFTLRKSIVPGAVDIVVEASTYVPSFYRGRALPSVESTVRLVAIPHLGGGGDPRTFSYRWEQNGSVIDGGGIRGKQSIDLLVPRYMGGNVRVIVSDEKGGSVAASSISLDATEPQIHFYEENPLRGLSDLAIRDAVSLIGDETTIHAEPYFMNTTRKGFDNMNFTWKVSGVPTENTSSDPHIITLRRTGGGGSTYVDTRIVTKQAIPQFVDGRFGINF